MKHSHIISEQLLRDFEPKQSWLAHDSYIHGVDHMARVFIFQELVCAQLEEHGVKINREAVRWAAMVHDVGRVDDGLDLEHGRRSAEWIQNHLSDKISPGVLEVVTYIAQWHVPSDKDAPAMTLELQVLKDADALDRVRLGDLDVRYLRTDAARSLVGIAEELFYAHETMAIDDAFERVIKAALEMGIVYKD